MSYLSRTELKVRTTEYETLWNWLMALGVSLLTLGIIFIIQCVQDWLDSGQTELVFGTILCVLGVGLLYAVKLVRGTLQ
jgi:hypothetical protein